MTLPEFADRLEQTGLPVAYLAFPEGEAPELPYICYLETGIDPMFADGTLYYAASRMRVELYMDARQPETEAELETILTGIGPWQKEIEYIDSEKCFAAAYELEV